MARPILTIRTDARPPVATQSAMGAAERPGGVGEKPGTWRSGHRAPAGKR
jgi:hypothetical protein